jgi:hypothetical protein
VVRNRVKGLVAVQKEDINRRVLVGAPLQNVEYSGDTTRGATTFPETILGNVNEMMGIEDGC